MLGVDRLDMIKGIPQKLLAYEKFLEENPDQVAKTLMVQIAVPSRTDVPEYQVRSTLFQAWGYVIWSCRIWKDPSRRCTGPTAVG